jgi:tryptophan 2,3-dioxygenase
MSDESKKYATVHYNNYLGLDKLLTSQNPKSAELDDKPAHDEMLFIIVHQAYELWFKQIIHELESVLDLFRKKRVHPRSIGIAISRLERVNEIQKLLIGQIRIMETMTPLDFLDFRNYLFPASGFQSYQFRMVENLLGLGEAHRITYNGERYDVVFDKSKKESLKDVADATSLFEAVEDWLERTPFIDFGDFNFLEAYKKALDRMLVKEQKAISETDYLTAEEKEMRLKMLGGTDTYFHTVLDKEAHEQRMKDGDIRLSYDATIAALFINLYRDEPILHLPFKLLVTLIEIDEALTTWRYRHAQMVMRMIGNKIGTGGSSGHAYLHKTAEKHHIFKDLHGISTLLIPRSELPELPKELREQLDFNFKHKE